jgi:hypothetical protein
MGTIIKGSDALATVGGIGKTISKDFTAANKRVMVKRLNLNDIKHNTFTHCLMR